MSADVLAERASPGPPGSGAGSSDDSRRIALVVLQVAALSWLALVFLHGGDGTSILDHTRLAAGEHAHGGALPAATGHEAAGHAAGAQQAAPGQALVVLGGWAVMVLAMMVPPALPMLSVVGLVVARRRHPRLLLLAGAATFVAAWTAVGAVMVAGDAALHALTADVGARAHLDSLVPGAVVLGAGVFQLTPLKRSCLRACRSPRSFALAHWRGRRTALTEVVTLTGAYTLSCIGCCWALMAISFAVGVAAMAVMVALAVFMAAERLVPWGARLTRPAGVLLLVLGAAIAARPFLTGLVTG